jgi:hypothetical protein
MMLLNYRVVNESHAFIHFFPRSWFRFQIDIIDNEFQKYILFELHFGDNNTTARYNRRWLFLGRRWQLFIRDKERGNKTTQVA